MKIYLSDHSLELSLLAIAISFIVSSLEIFLNYLGEIKIFAGFLLLIMGAFILFLATKIKRGFS